MTEQRRLGGVLALRETWCRPDEKILWCCDGAKPRFDVPGVNPDGSTGKGQKRLETAFAVADLLSGEPDSDTGVPTPKVIASGTSANTEAPRLAYAAAAEPGLWVLTTQRFAYVAPVPDPTPPPAPQQRGLLGKLRSQAENVRSFVSGGPAYVPGEPVPVRAQRSVFELHSGQVTATGPSVWKRPRFHDLEPVFDSFVFADRSMLSFFAGPGEGRIQGARQTTRLMPLSEEK
ncbi:hypothetical protein [Phytomonospora endophytica]|uniref:Uncharacterized protein n=1 Tax=Phytomonospora endophytica TaxID=714109 RepID=A0A841FN70_9ACTN|nr:hypothetical protein [Phytomonospora endophytica]MBB6038761.1 hypothetical protein [Phytomonospora endophytica]GIG68443.1 hypothetical protein Pen01_47380 [Phytomonospora endophytica]